MAFTSNLDEMQPTGSEAAGTIDNIIRDVRLQMKERFASLTTGVNTDPMQLKAGAIPSGYALTSPTITGASLVNPTLSGTITGLPFTPSLISGPNSTGSINTANTYQTLAQYNSLPAGTYVIQTIAFLSAVPTTGSSFLGKLRLFNVTSGSVIGSAVDCFIITGLASLQGRQSIFMLAFTLGSTATIRVEGACETSGSFTGSPNGTHASSVLYRWS